MKGGKVRIKYRDFEIEVEGTEEFIDSYLSKTIGNSIDIMQFENKAIQPNIEPNDKKVEGNRIKNFETLIKKMKVKNTRDLIIASAYYWSCIKNIKSYPENDLYKTVIMEKKLYKKFGSNFKETLAKLVNENKLIQKNGNYELSIELKNKIEKKIK